MSLYIFNTVYQDNWRLVILESAQTCFICSDRVTDETKAFTPQCKLRIGHDSIRNYDAHIIVCSARISNTMCFLKDVFHLALLF